jgi:hypothetical protein
MNAGNFAVQRRRHGKASGLDGFVNLMRVN